MTNLNEMANAVHAANKKWWHNIETGEPIKRNKGELIALFHSEISECDDGEQEGLMDDKLPNRLMGEVECVDAIIRMLDYAAGFGYDLNQAGLKVGLSEFDGLSHVVNCVRVFDIPLRLQKRGISLIHSQISKLLELERKSHPAAEIADALMDCILHIVVWANARNYDLQGAYVDKMAYNANRQDHTHEARRIAGGKQF